MRETDDFRFSTIHTSPKGSEFIVTRAGRLFAIHMKNGGVRPDFTQTKYTSYSKAKQALDQYFKDNPKPVERVKSKKAEG